MMRLNRVRWLKRWAADSKPEILHTRGISRMLGWFYVKGLISYPSAYTHSITEKGLQDLQKAEAEYLLRGTKL
jgi:hypothetical protein